MQNWINERESNWHGIRASEYMCLKINPALVFCQIRLRTDGAAARIHFASAMTMMGEHDGSSQQHSYLEIMSFLEEYSSRTEEDCRELWRRIVFNICIGNTDDHLRNHGFILKDEMWQLSPAYDMNPDYEHDQLSLAVDMVNPEKDIRNALEVSEYFRINRREANMA